MGGDCCVGAGVAVTVTTTTFCCTEVGDAAVEAPAVVVFDVGDGLGEVFEDMQPAARIVAHNNSAVSPMKKCFFIHNTSITVDQQWLSYVYKAIDYGIYSIKEQVYRLSLRCTRNRYTHCDSRHR